MDRDDSGVVTSEDIDALKAKRENVPFEEMRQRRQSQRANVSPDGRGTMLEQQKSTLARRGDQLSKIPAAWRPLPARYQGAYTRTCRIKRQAGIILGWELAMTRVCARV